MNRPVVWRSNARRELVNQLSYLRQKAGRQVALRFQQEVDQALSTVVKFPEAGSQKDLGHPDLANIRIWQLRHFPNHLIFYIPSDDAIVVVAVIHSSEDYNRKLKPTE